ncbi:MAG: IS1634 family transposase [Pirellulaceae bacterium]
MDATTRFQTKRVGALPVVVAYLEKMRLAQIIDERVPWNGDIPLGTLVEIMVCNRLLNPKAQYKIGEWAERAGVCDYYDIPAEQLNDDRLGRALERVAKHAFSIQSQLVLHLVKTFKLKVTNIHYDISNVELYGAYERQLKQNGEDQTELEEPSKDETTTEGDEKTTTEGPQPMYGRTKSGRKNVKQVQFGINVTRDGAVPIDLLPFDGNEAEVKTHIENMQRLRDMLPTKSLVYTADTKFDSPENLLTNKAAGGQFLCGGVLQPQLKDEYRKHLKEMKLVDYCPKSKQHLPDEKRPKYKTYEKYKTIAGEVDGRQVRLQYRQIFVWSEAKAEQEGKTRQRHLSKIRAEFEAIERNLNKYSLKTREKIVSRLELAKGKYAVGEVFHYELSRRSGKFSLRWHIDERELKRLAQLDGAYVLKTDLPKKQYPTSKVLVEYKEQIHVERRIGDMKGPLAIAPMFLEKPLRIAGLMYVLLWALMALSLMERDVRQSLDGEPMYGIYPEGRPSRAPTGRSILEQFEDLAIVIMKHKGETHRRLAELNTVQRRLIEMMNIPPNALRAFKTKCCRPPDRQTSISGCGT